MDMESAVAFNKSLRKGKWSRRTGRAFIIEVLFLFAFLICSLTVITQLFVGSVNEAAQARDLERAINIASNTAERFAANPHSNELNYSQDGLTVVCDVDAQPSGAGTLYVATITIFNDGGAFYSIDTARYESGVS